MSTVRHESQKGRVRTIALEVRGTDGRHAFRFAFEKVHPMAADHEPNPPAKPSTQSAGPSSENAGLAGDVAGSEKHAADATRVPPSGPSTAAIDEMRARQASDDEVERSLWEGGYSGKAMLGTWVGCGAISIAILAAAIAWESLPFTWGLIGVAVLWLVAAGTYAWRRLGIAYELTTQRFIHQSGVLSRRTDRIEVIDIDDVTYRQGPVQRILGVGEIIIESSDRSHPELRMLGIDNVRKVADLIDDVRRKERRRRSLHIEAV